METRVLSRGSDVAARIDSEFVSHVAHSKPGVTPIPAKFYVITPIFNPSRY